MFIKYSEGRIDGIYNNKDDAKKQIRKDNEQDKQEDEEKIEEEKN